MNTENKETIKFYDGNKYTINYHEVLDGELVGRSLYNSDPNHAEDFALENASHIIREFVALDQNGNYELTIEFLDNEHGRKAKDAYALIKAGTQNGLITPFVVSSCGKILRVDITYDWIKDIPLKSSCVPTKKLEYTLDKLKDMFKYTNDDMEALKLCAQYKNHIEIVNDGGQSWIQKKDGINDEDILYDFKEDFGNRDGIYNLFKMLNINAKSV